MGRGAGHVVWKVSKNSDSRSASGLALAEGKHWDVARCLTGRHETRCDVHDCKEISESCRPTMGSVQPAREASIPLDINERLDVRKILDGLENYHSPGVHGVARGGEPRKIGVLTILNIGSWRTPFRCREAVFRFIDPCSVRHHDGNLQVDLKMTFAVCVAAERADHIMVIRRPVSRTSIAARGHDAGIGGIPVTQKCRAHAERLTSSRRGRARSTTTPTFPVSGRHRRDVQRRRFRRAPHPQHNVLYRNINMLQFRRRVKARKSSPTESAPDRRRA